MHLNEKAKFGRWATFGLLGLMFLVMFYWSIHRTTGFSWPILLIQCLPLALILPSLIQGHYRSYSWLCFILLMYFIFAVMNALQSKAQITDLVYVALVVLLFTVAMMTSRWQQYIQKNV